MPADAYTVKGSVECPDIVRENNNENFREMNKWWMLGYFTARNFATDASVGKDIDDDNIYNMALGFCEQNNDKDWDDAAIHVYDLLD
jgi:hypothetical protein